MEVRHVRSSATESQATSCASAPSAPPAASRRGQQRRRDRVRIAAWLFALASGCAPAVQQRSLIREVPPPGAAPVVYSEGKASWYGREQHGHLTANGERFNMFALTAAHRTFKMNTQVRVRNLQNGRTVVVRINDRGPYSKGRIIDLSYAAAEKLGMLGAGVVPVRLEVVEGGAPTARAPAAPLGRR